ncbi:hypothetical protein [Sphingomonas sp.]|uniref:hypothetical protein n=1 Tax=Sphingomonas sp. TaxID=28214 RepID=UPI003F726768
MSSSLPAYHRCYISAPVGLKLGALPELLTAHGIAWEWADGTNPAEQNSRDQIAAADFVLIVLNGTRADYQGVFDAGIATGLDKPAFLLQGTTRPLPVDLRRFASAKVSLNDKDALEFHLELFLSTPRDSTRPAEASKPATGLIRPQSGAGAVEPPLASGLERRVFDAVIAAGGTAIAEPPMVTRSRYRPDLLASFGEIEPELLDLVAIEVKGRVEGGEASKVEDRLLAFMTSARVKTGLVITEALPPSRGQQLSPNILWLSIDLFEQLAQSGRVGGYVRETRNRIRHGSR